MYRLFRFYNQNRKKIWLMIGIIAFVFLIIQLLNNIAKEQNEKDRQQHENIESQETTFNNVVSYDKQSESIISENKVSGKRKVTYGELIDEFFTYCINHNPEKAYELLSTDMKNNMYESEALFESLYYSSKFEGNKQYSFQSWTTGNNRYTYQVKIFDDMLSTGKSNNNYIEDYVTIVEENESYKLNVNSYIGKEVINETAQNENISLQVINKYIYKDYQIFDIVVKNNTENQILLDTRENTKETYLLDNNDNKFEALLYENSEKDLLLKANEIKKIKIKFNIVENENLKIKSINFDNIVLNYEQFNLNNENKKVDSIKVSL